MNGLEWLHLEEIREDEIYGVAGGGGGKAHWLWGMGADDFLGLWQWISITWNRKPLLINMKIFLSCFLKCPSKYHRKQIENDGHFFFLNVCSNHQGVPPQPLARWKSMVSATLGQTYLTSQKSQLVGQDWFFFFFKSYETHGTEYNTYITGTRESWTLIIQPLLLFWNSETRHTSAQDTIER